MLKIIINIFKCNLLNSHICDYSNNNKQLTHLTLSYKNCFRIYINDKLVPKQSVYLVSTFKETKSIKIKLIGIFNNQTHFIEVKSKSIDVNFPLFEKRNAITTIESIHKLSHKKIMLSSLMNDSELKVSKKLERTYNVNISKNKKNQTELKNKNYNLTNIINYYE
jgi:hypothetical protein